MGNSIIEGLAEKYGVATPEELEALIREGRVEEHPAWEDLILWEHLRDRARAGAGGGQGGTQVSGERRSCEGV